MENPRDFPTAADYASRAADKAKDAADLNSKKLKRLINLLIAKGVITDEEINGPQLVYRHSHAAYDE